MHKVFAKWGKTVRNYLTLDICKEKLFASTAPISGMLETTALDSINFGREPRLNPLLCPSGVLSGERLRLASRPFQRRQILARAHISKRDTHVTQKTAPFDSVDG